MKKRKDGRYQTKVTLLNGKYKFIYGKTAKEVKVKKEQLLLQVSMGGTRINDKITVQDWAEKWWKIAKEGRTGNSSQDGYIRAMNHYIFPHIGGMKLRDVKNIHIQQLINDIGESGKSLSLQKKVLITLNNMFIYALRNGIIVSNPAQFIEYYKVPIKERTALTPEQCQTLLLVCKRYPRAELAIHMGLFLGVRRGELIGAQWNDIDNQTRTVRICRSAELVNNQAVLKSTKTVAGNRSIPIPEHLWDMLQNTPKKSLFIVPSAKGSILSETAFRKMMEPIKNKLDFYFTYHMLRHTYATTLEKIGISSKMCQYLLGHANDTTTKKIYTHIQEDYILSVSSQLNTLFDSIQKASFK